MFETHTIVELRKKLSVARAENKRVGFVPTMGYFHEGHLTLMREAKKRADVVVVSIFVNPTQFGPNEDLEKYPVDLKRDRAMAESVGVDILFTPSAGEIYPEGYATSVNVEGIADVLCGRSRPGHFSGVATVVAKLLNIVEPDVAVFGEKDWQQLAVVRRIAADLNIDSEILGVPTVREADGLAMSSRNTYLSAGERKAALVLAKSLRIAQEMVDKNIRETAEVERAMRDVIEAESLVEIEYLEFCDPQSLAGVAEIESDTLIAIAARVGKTRLIDNAVVRPG
ncbi:MAG: pantoate--beta-alanine ligase [Candidatus Aquicultor primus]|uniref:Pantothenate synthetase n=1 Tax=Candidatus Aquicultor primus TaxID=1797195 RepID=A0A1F2ULA4_9ACTN|nr:MAG: pantoate--beta-alanine ligase [Candidatus Aquicultor primus]HCG98572.1 pantoate--beta-alanine ligase [Actinomycetota bacterium]